MNNLMENRIEQMVDYIMKKCLWQFQSRAWDRERQNEEILKKTMQLLCDEPVDLATPADRCFWADAVCLADAYRERFQWLTGMDKTEIKDLMQVLKERMDYLTIKGSLNEELMIALY
jgi:nitrogenase delta subunit